MKTIISLPIKIILVLGIITVIHSCTKSNDSTPPSLTTAAVSGITQTTAVSGGNITDDNGSDITARGVCWGEATNPTIAGSHTTDGNGKGSFTSNINGLTAGTMYHVRAYATNSAGTAYGDEVSFTTTSAGSLASLTTTALSAITATSAASGGNITDDNGSDITARGVCWSTTASPVATGLHTTDGTGTGAFTSSISGLTAGTLYYVRAYATNSAGTAYGNQVTFTTINGPALNEVWIQDDAFSPATITVAVGTTVTWTNKDAVSHTITSNSALFESGSIANNGTYSHQFNTVGSFGYYCTIHTFMTGTVIVQ